MPSASRLRSLMRPAAAVARLGPAAAAPFSSSAAALTLPQPPRGSKAPVAGRVRRPPANKRIKREPPPEVPAAKRPSPGERKAFRKRVQLSNNAALPVAGLGQLGPATMADPASTGSMFAIPDAVVDQLRTLGAFRPSQSWGLFRKPHVLVRAETADLVGRLGAAREAKAALRCVLTGSWLSGKSLLLLQAMTHALLNGWVVVHIPEGEALPPLAPLPRRRNGRSRRPAALDLITGNLDYVPIANTAPMQFSQPSYSLALLQKVYKANRAILEKLPAQRDWSQTITGWRPGTTLADLALGAREGVSAWTTLSALWTELTLPGRPPVLFGLDGLGHANRLTEYRDPSSRPVHAHDLALVRVFIDALSGATPLPNGGAVVAATSSGNNLRPIPSQDLALAQLEAGQAGREVPRPEPYKRGYDERVYEALKNTHVLRVGCTSKDESRALIEYWAASGLFKGQVSAMTVAEKWALGGHGIVGEMERASLMTMRM